MSPRHLALLVLGFLLPPSRVKNAVLSRLGDNWSIAPSARIFHVLIVGVPNLVAGPGSVLGTGTVLRRLSRVELGPGALVGAWNWITAAPALAHLSDRAGSFVMGRESALTSRHYVDCSGGVALGAFSTVAGVRTTFISHGIDIDRSEQTAAAITVGAYCLVSSNVKLTPGSSVPDRCLVAMGAVVIPGLTDTECLYAGVPATLRRKLGPGDYFSRDAGAVGPRPDDAAGRGSG